MKNMMMGCIWYLVSVFLKRKITHCLERPKLGLVVKDVKPGVLVQAVVH